MLEKAKGKEKERILRESVDNTALRELLDATFNFSRKYYIKQVSIPDLRTGVSGYGADKHAIFVNLLKVLESGDFRGSKAKSMVEAFMAVCDERQRKWYVRIIKKDLKAGFGITTVNKVGFNIPNHEIMKAMDAFECSKLDKLIQEGGFESPKLDGYRCTAIIIEGEVTLLSMNGIVFKNFPQVEQQLALSFPKGKFVFDGEIISDDFQQMQKSAFAYVRGTVVGDVRYHIFDTIPYEEWVGNDFQMIASSRYRLLEERKAQFKSGTLVVVPHTIVTSKDQIMNYMLQCIEAELEGAMFNPDIPYYRGRPSNRMLKFKLNYDMDCEVLDYKPGESDSKYKDTLGAMVVLQENGLICNVSGFKDVDRDEIWNNQEKYRGKIVKVKYQELTDANIMRFPRFVEWRIDK